MNFYDIMNEACTNINIDFNEDKYNKFILYKELLQEWNEKINLTAITEDEGIIKKHFIDSLKCFQFEELKNAERIIDIGTGAGLPGIPIKIAAEDKKIVLLDSLNKRINFLNEVISKLKLNNIETIHGRAEEFSRKEGYRESFDIAISRAVANLTVLCELCIPYVKVGGYFVAMKGPAVEEELNEAQKAIDKLGGKLLKVIKVKIEDSDLQHNLVIIKKIKNTPSLYPRTSTNISKKPLR